MATTSFYTCASKVPTALTTRFKQGQQLKRSTQVVGKKTLHPSCAAVATPVASQGAVRHPAIGTARSPRKENAEGDFFVDHTCINCDVCRWMAPEVFHMAGNQSAVHTQPGTDEDRRKALQALISCPTASIHTQESSWLLKEEQHSFPLPIDASIPGVYHCGYHSRKSFGAASYFIQRQGGNILVDTPRFCETLATKLESLGGVRYIILTHRDDVADHARWAARFKAVRLLHVLEVNADTTDVEMKLEGTGPWSVGHDIDVIFTPGHTEGHVAVMYKNHGGVLFSGDHLAYSATLNGLTIFRRVNWFSVPVQVKSVRKLQLLQFSWLLPGHGRRYHFSSHEEQQTMLQNLVEAEEGY